MGKYIVDIASPNVRNEYIVYWTHDGLEAKRVSDLTPYTEPDTEEAYRRGYETAKHECEDCNKGEKYTAEDAWEAVRKIALKPEIAECVDDLVRIGFNVGTAGSWSEAIELLFDKYSASEAIEKVRQYEREEEKQEEKDSVTAENVMRQYLNAFCHGRNCEGCPLNTYGFTCGRGSHFTTARNPVSDEEVRKAYTTVLQKMKEK